METRKSLNEANFNVKNKFVNERNLEFSGITFKRHYN